MKKPQTVTGKIYKIFLKRSRPFKIISSITLSLLLGSSLVMAGYQYAKKSSVATPESSQVGGPIHVITQPDTTFTINPSTNTPTPASTPASSSLPTPSSVTRICGSSSKKLLDQQYKDADAAYVSKVQQILSALNSAKTPQDYADLAIQLNQGISSLNGQYNDFYVKYSSSVGQSGCPREEVKRPSLPLCTASNNPPYLSADTIIDCVTNVHLQD
jgi:hypothetical protein